MLRPTLCALVAFVTVAAPALAAERPIVAIEAHSLVTREGRDLKGDLRALVQREVDALDFGKTPSARCVLSASLIKLDTATEGGKTRSSARVSVVLKDAKGGAVRAILGGRATAEDTPSAAARAEASALEAAVRGALKTVPEAVK